MHVVQRPCTLHVCAQYSNIFYPISRLFGHLDASCASPCRRWMRRVERTSETTL